MRHLVTIVMALSIILTGCDGQTKNTQKQKADNLPQTNIKVNKEYDKNGNIIKFDSSYSSFYSNVKADSNLRDSIFKNFKNQFNRSYFFSNQPYFKDFFFADSLLRYDFYKKDFFFNRFRNNINRMDSLFREMDVMKDDFFSKQLKPHPQK